MTVGPAGPTSNPSTALGETGTGLASHQGWSSVDTRFGRRRLLLLALLRSKIFVVGFLVVLFWVFDALFWHLLVPHDPQALAGTPLDGPSGEHWLGTDDLGRDVFSRALAGASSTLTVAPAATALCLALGVPIGLVTGYYRGLVDEGMMRVIDAMLAFPAIILATLAISVLGRSALNVILVIGLVFTPRVARTVRSAVLVEREREFVAAAKLQGESGPYIMAAEILPNITGPIAVEATVRLGYAIFATAALAFLGLGLSQPSPDWGLTVSLGRVYLQTAPWMVLAPALALATLVVAVNLVADGLKQVVEE